MSQPNRIRDLRKRRGLTQAELAREVGTSQQQVARWEAGSRPSLDDAVALALALGAPIQAVFPEVAQVTGQPRIDRQKAERILAFADCLRQSLEEAFAQ